MEEGPNFRVFAHPIKFKLVEYVLCCFVQDAAKEKGTERLARHLDCRLNVARVTTSLFQAEIPSSRLLWVFFPDWVGKRK